MINHYAKKKKDFELSSVYPYIFKYENYARKSWFKYLYGKQIQLSLVIIRFNQKYNKNVNNFLFNPIFFRKKNGTSIKMNSFISVEFHIR